MSANNITSLCQKASAAYTRLQAISFVSDPENQIREGMVQMEEKDIDSLPIIICSCMTAECEEWPEGNWSANLRIEIRSNSDDDSQEHHTRSGEVFGVWMDSPENMRNNLSAAIAGFTAQMVLPVNQGWDINDRSWVSWMTFTVKCCGSTFSVA